MVVGESRVGHCIGFVGPVGDGLLGRIGDVRSDHRDGQFLVQGVGEGTPGGQQLLGS